MSITNRYVKRSRILEAKFRELVRYFSLDLDAHKIAFLTRLNLNTVNRYLLLIRQRIAEFCEGSSPFKGEIEIDESYFGALRIKGKRGRGASGKTTVFGIFQRGGSVYTEIIPDCARRTLLAIIRGRIEPETASSTRITGEVTAASLTWATKSIIVSTMERMNLQTAEDISTALNPSGPMPKGGLPSSTVYPDRPSIYISKSVSSGSITATKISTGFC